MTKCPNILIFVFVLIWGPWGHTEQTSVPSFADLAEDSIAAVVSIISKLQSPQSSDNKMVYQIDGRVYGAGFIIDPQGFIVTNYHNIMDSSHIDVILEENTQVPAQVIGVDPSSDLALLKIDTDKKLHALSWGDSQSIRVGDWMLTIGNPFGLKGTVTAGIISAKARELGDLEHIMLPSTTISQNYLQTDAPISEGNSGGPMLNLKGEVIGVSTLFVSPTGGSAGIGFGIPTHTAKPIIESLKEKGYVVRPWIGLDLQNISPQIAASIGMEEAQGVLVIGVEEHSPALNSDIKTGDIIIAFNGMPVKNAKMFLELIQKSSVNVLIQLTLLRKGELFHKQIFLKQKDAPNTPPQEKNQADTSLYFFGLKLEETPKDLANAEETKICLYDTQQILPNLETPLYILKINDQDIDSIEKAKTYILEHKEKNSGRPILFFVEKDGQRYFTAYDLPAH